MIGLARNSGMKDGPSTYPNVSPINWLASHLRSMSSASCWLICPSGVVLKDSVQWAFLGMGER